MLNLEELWKIHQLKSFPKGLGGKDVNDICVSSLDTYISGCISYFIKRGLKELDVDRLLVLKKGVVSLDNILVSLNDESLEYFSLLRDMALIVIDSAEIA